MGHGTATSQSLSLNIEMLSFTFVDRSESLAGAVNCRLTMSPTKCMLSHVDIVGSTNFGL